MLKTVVDTLDGLDEAMHELYTETDGQFILNVEGVDQHPEVANLKSAYERVKAKEAEARQKAKDAETLLAEAMKGKPDEAALAAERKSYEDKIAELEGKLTETEGKLTGVTRDSALAAALNDAGVTNPAYVKAATAMLGSQVKMVDGKAVVDAGMGPVDVSQFVKRWAASEGKDFVTPPAGGGAKGKDDGKTPEKNPWAKETHNLTEQARILQSDPALADRLKAAAGSK